MQTICGAEDSEKDAQAPRMRQARVLALRRVDAVPFVATGLLDDGAPLVLVLAVFTGTGAGFTGTGGTPFVFFGGRPLAFFGGEGSGSGSGVGSCSDSSDSRIG
jgi:hypothetical protein